MSYDLMVFEPDAAPRERSAFNAWYACQVEWSEEHDYNEPSVASPALQAWFQEMIKVYPPMNGPLATDDVDDPRMTDYSIGRTVIYAAFAWSCTNEAYHAVRELADKHCVGFFDVSSSYGQIIFPDGESLFAHPKKPWWKLW